MNKKVQIITSSIVIISICFWYTHIMAWHSPITALYAGIVQFPSCIKEIPSIRIYYSGNKISCTTQNDNKKITFSISSHNRHLPLYVLVTEHVEWDAEENTIKNLKTNMQRPYKLYQLINNKIDSDTKESNSFLSAWNIQEESLDSNGTIPDNTIIIVFNPEWIETIKGGDSITLPTLYVLNNILNLIESEDTLHATTQALLLSAIDSDSIHKKIQCVVKPHYGIKKVLALTT